MQHQTLMKAKGCCASLARSEQDAPRRLGGTSPEREKIDAAGAPFEQGEYFADTLRLMDDHHHTRRRREIQGPPNPGRKIGFALDMALGTARLLRRARPARDVKRRVGKDDVEAAFRHRAGRMQQIAHNNGETIAHPVQPGISGGKFRQCWLNFETCYLKTRLARAKAEGRGGDTAAEIEGAPRLPRRHRGGEKDGIDSDTISGRRLTQQDAAAENAIFGDSGRG